MLLDTIWKALISWFSSFFWWIRFLDRHQLISFLCWILEHLDITLNITYWALRGAILLKYINYLIDFFSQAKHGQIAHSVEKIIIIRSPFINFNIFVVTSSGCMRIMWNWISLFLFFLSFRSAQLFILAVTFAWNRICWLTHIVFLFILEVLALQLVFIFNLIDFICILNNVQSSFLNVFGWEHYWFHIIYLIIICNHINILLVVFSLV